jgi:hypothetical protein
VSNRVTSISLMKLVYVCLDLISSDIIIEIERKKYLGIFFSA